MQDIPLYAFSKKDVYKIRASGQLKKLFAICSNQQIEFTKKLGASAEYHNTTFQAESAENKQERDTFTDLRRGK